MKNKMIVSAICLATVLVSCDQKKSIETENRIETTQGATMDSATAKMESNAISVTTEAVPKDIQTTFNKKHPAVKKIEWSRYTPSEEDEMDRTTDYYFVRFNNNGEDYIDWYNTRGEWVKSSTTLKGASNLPDAVNEYLNKNYEGYTVEEINKENDKDMDMYEIKLNKGEQKAKIKILPNGEIFKKKTK